MRMRIISLSWHLGHSKSVVSVVILIWRILQWYQVWVSHDFVMYVKMSNGIWKIEPLSLASMWKVSTLTCSKCLVGSLICGPKHSKVTIWAINCSVNRFGMSKPWWLCGPCATAHGKCWFIPIAGRALASTDFIMSWHCSLVKFVAISGYANFGIRICLKLNSASVWFKFDPAMCLPQSVATSCRCWASAMSLPSGANLTPNVQWASNGSKFGIVIHLF